MKPKTLDEEMFDLLERLVNMDTILEKEFRVCTVTGKEKLSLEVETVCGNELYFNLYRNGLGQVKNVLFHVNKESRTAEFIYCKRPGKDLKAADLKETAKDYVRNTIVSWLKYLIRQGYTLQTSSNSVIFPMQCPKCGGFFHKRAETVRPLTQKSFDWRLK